MRKGTPNEASGTLQATIIKKCDQAHHRPETSKACAGGTCQHTCEPSEIGACRHAWTVRYSVNGTQREKSFRDEIDGRKRVVPGSGLAKARDFQLELTRGKRAQGKTYTDPKRAEEPFTEHAAQFIKASARLTAGENSRKTYQGILRGDIAKAFGDRTLAQMATAGAADDVATFLNVTLSHRSIQHRRSARMIIVWAMDAAVKADKVPRHKLAGITLTKGIAARRQRRAEEDDDESATGFVFISDAQVRVLAEGGTFPPAAPGKRPRALKGVGIAAWLQRAMGLRIREALGVEKRHFRQRKDGSRYLRLRSQATRDGKGREPLKHRAEGEGRDVAVPDFVWNMVQAMPDGPLCPGISSRYLPYNTARDRFVALTAAMGIRDYTTHSLRHQFASEALDEGANIANIAAILGH
ncbi:MAG: hypothetical protein J2P25_20620, partial [Nocardiopsaceae bacterium]|nr:hypothetical protein [Nocardiopsaceae bacterium]